MKKSKFSIILAVFILFIASIIIAASVYIHVNYKNQNIDEMVYYLFNGVEGSSSDVFTSAIATSIIPFLLLLAFIIIPIIPFKIKRNIIEVSFRNKMFTFPVFPIFKFRLLYASFMLLLSLVVCFNLLNIGAFYQHLTDYSKVIDDNYVDGKKVSLSFPEKKRNVIILYIESGENSFIDKQDGGGWSYSVMPEMENIAMENTNFSNSDKIGGAQPVSGTTWTVGGIVASTAGLPLKIPINGNDYTSSKDFLGGAYTMGDILHKEGYNQEFLVGSDAGFGGRSNYYEKHGNFKIFDLNTAIKEGKMAASQKQWWGFDDTHLFSWAEEEITNLANSNKPFNFDFLTADTHFPDGYLENGAAKKFGTQYENVYAFTSKQVGEFVTWLKAQPFYNNTTLVITGDHLSMEDPKYFDAHTYKGYTRTIYNAFVNPAIQPVNAKNRTFTSLDLYPTILASLGVKIEGNRLGLGTNLFSNKKTLAEELTLANLDQELAKNSKFYDNNILKGDYLSLVKKEQN